MKHRDVTVRVCRRLCFNREDDAVAQSANLNEAVSKLATDAVNYAQGKMTKGADNRWGDYVSAAVGVYVDKDHVKSRERVVEMGKVVRCVDDSRTRANLEVARLNAENRTRSWTYNLEEYAKAGTVNHCGNCEEYSAMAFVYLRDTLHVKQ